MLFAEDTHLSTHYLLELKLYPQRFRTVFFSIILWMNILFEAIKLMLLWGRLSCDCGSGLIFIATVEAADKVAFSLLTDFERVECRWILQARYC